MASALNLCQHFDPDGTICTSNDYVLCPHCQLQLCLRHLNVHQELLRSDCVQLSDDINRLRESLNFLKFDSNNQGNFYLQQIDQWYQQKLDSLNRVYREKQEQFRLFYFQAQIEFEKCKTQKERQINLSLAKQWLKVSRQKQIHVDDLNEMKYKLTNIERGLDELKQLLIDFSVDPTTEEIIIVKRRYVEASKTSFHDDDDHFLWDIDEEENEEKQIFDRTTDIAQDSIDKSNVKLNEDSSNVIEKKEPLKFVIKRLQQPLRSKKIKYRFQTLSSSRSIRT